MKKINIIHFYLLALIIFLLLIFYIEENSSKKTENINGNNGIQDVIKNMADYEEYFKDKHVNAQIVTNNGKEFLKIIFDSGIEAVYGPDLIKIKTQILWRYYSNEYLVDLEINNIDRSKNTAQVSTSYDGGYETKVCYYLPDFYEIKPDWGDYLQADLDIKKIISKEELQKTYMTTERMKEMINNEYLIRRKD
ncbi:hypothetical protein [Lacrimispora sp.]|uniref:hypothetical protein n=1 Tax=Lacrimispora sp. TaxID=2719234 RepID=UPI003993987E